MNKQKRAVKGEYGYVKNQTKAEIIKTIAFFGISIALLVMGYITTKTKTNLLTVVAVLGLLPASKSLVSMIMYLKIPQFKEEIFQSIEKKKGSVQVLYNMYLTSYKKNFALNAIAIRGNHVIAFSEFANCDAEAGETHIQDLAKLNSLKSLTIKIFKDQKKFEERLVQLDALENSEREADIVALLCDISL